MEPAHLSTRFDVLNENLAGSPPAWITALIAIRTERRESSPGICQTLLFIQRVSQAKGVRKPVSARRQPGSR
jgi:hypothetical protein